MKPKSTVPAPIDGVDFYTTGMYRYTVCIDLAVEGIEELFTEEDACFDAITKFRNGNIDGDAQVVYSEHINDVELCLDTDEPFDRKAWLKAKMFELGLNAAGNPLRPYEKHRHSDETTLDKFVLPDEIVVVPIRELSYDDAKKEILDYIKKAGDRKVYISEVAEALAIDFKLIEEIWDDEDD